MPHLVDRRDHGFHIYRQLCLYLFKLGRRCIKAKSLPQETDLAGILSVSVSDDRALAVPDFIARSKLDQRLNTACKLKAEKELGDKKANRANLPNLVKQSKEEFERLGCSYVAYLFHAAQNNSQLTSDIVKGMGSFDLDIMFRSPLSQALHCFKQLFRSFHVRGYYQANDESICTEEYLSFVDELRKEFPDLDQPRVIITDAVTFISGHVALSSRPHLTRIFRLSCLCLDQGYTAMPPVKFGPVQTDDSKSKLIDTVLPVQSFFMNVGRSISAFTTASSVSDFLAFEPTFGGTAFTDTYSPWDGLDLFNRAEILATLQPVSVKNKADTRRLRFKGLNSGKVSKSLPPSSARNSPVKRPSDSESFLLAHPLKTFNCTICTFVFSCIYVSVELFISFLVCLIYFHICLYSCVILALVFEFPLRESDWAQEKMI